MAAVRDQRTLRVRRWLWFWLLSVPGVLVLLVVSSGLLLRPPAVHAARCYFDALTTEVLAARCSLLRWQDGQQRPAALPVTLRLVHPSGEVTEHPVESGVDGLLEVNIPVSGSERGALELRLSERGAPERVLAQGRLTPSGAAKATRRGGWIEGQVEGPVDVRVGLLSGVLAVPFESTLRVVLERNAEPLAQQPFTIELDGARRLEPEAPLRTDEAGRMDIPIVAQAHHVALVVRVEAAPETRYRGTLPVVPGAIHARVEAASLIVESPIPRQVAFVNVIDTEQIYLAKRVSLEPQAGRYVGRLELPSGSSGKWAMTSSEYDMQSMAAVGWPLSRRSVTATLERRMGLGLDGLQAARQRAEQRRGAWRWIGLGAALLALALELGLLAIYFRSWDEHDPVFAKMLSRPRSRAPFWVAASCMVVGFAALTGWWWSRF